MKAIVFQNNVLRFEPEHEVADSGGRIPVRVQLAGICETDLQLVQGYMGFAGVLGHEFVGIAESGKFAGKRVVGEINCACQRCDFCRKGMSNHCPQRSVIGILNHDGAFAERVFVPEENLHEVPDRVPNDVAVFTEPLAAAFQIPNQINLAENSKTVVIGDGRLAFLIAQVLRLKGCEVLVVGKHAEKLKHFKALDFETETLSDPSVNRAHDLAVDCTGSPTGIPTAMNYLRPRGTLVLKSTFAEQAPINLAAIVIDEINLVGSRCGPFDVALKALEQESIEVKSTIDARFALEDGVAAMEFAAQSGVRKVLLEING